MDLREVMSQGMDMTARCMSKESPLKNCNLQLKASSASNLKHP